MTMRTNTDDDILVDMPLDKDSLDMIRELIENSADPLLEVTTALMAARRAHMTIAFGTIDSKIATALIRELTTASLLIDDFLADIEECCNLEEIEEPVELESATQREPRQ